MFIFYSFFLFILSADYALFAIIYVYYPRVKDGLCIELCSLFTNFVIFCEFRHIFALKYQLNMHIRLYAADIFSLKISSYFSCFFRLSPISPETNKEQSAKRRLLLRGFLPKTPNTQGLPVSGHSLVPILCSMAWIFSTVSSGEAYRVT